MASVLIFHTFSKKSRNATLGVKYIGAGLEDSLQEPILCRNMSDLIQFHNYKGTPIYHDIFMAG